MAVALCAAMVFPTCMTAVIINMRKQYNENGQASLTMEFAGRKLEICICNPEKKLPSEYKIKTVWCDEKEMKNKQSTCVRIERELLEKLSVKETHRIKVELM